MTSGFGRATLDENLNPVQDEWDFSDHTGLRAIRGGHFRGGADFTNVFHFAIPTPLSLTEKRTRLLAVWVNLEREEAASPQHVLIADGDNVVANLPFNPVNLDVNQRLQLPGPELFFGVLLSVIVHFSREEHVRFRCVGAEYDVP